MESITRQNTYKGIKIYSVNRQPELLLSLLAICEKNIVRYVILAVSMLPVIGVVSKGILAILYTFLILSYIRKHGARLTVEEAAVPVFIVLAILGTVLFYPQNSQYIFDPNNFWNTIFPCLRWYIVALVITPNKETMDALGVASIIGVLVETAFLFLYMIPAGLLKTDDMSRAYQLLPNVLLVINYAIEKKKILPWCFAAVGMIYILSMGTRGPVVVMLVFLFVKLIKWSSHRKGAKFLLLLTIAAIGMIYSNQTLYMGVLRTISEVFRGFGFSTRVIDHALNRTMITYMSERDIIYSTMLQKITERPFIGYGVYGEWSWFGWNAHNMFLEILVHFGIILGGAIIFWILRTVIKCFLETKNTYAKDIILIWGCLSFVRGIFGGSYLQIATFFLIGFCLAEKHRMRQMYRYSQEEL
jgi:hypothetical protein